MKQVKHLVVLHSQTLDLQGVLSDDYCDCVGKNLRNDSEKKDGLSNFLMQCHQQFTIHLQP